jgi:hypothetical protein
MDDVVGEEERNYDAKGRLWQRTSHVGGYVTWRCQGDSQTPYPALSIRNIDISGILASYDHPISKS